MTHRVRNIAAAAGLAVVAAILVAFYVTNYKRSVEHSQQQVGVYVAAKEIPAGTAGSNVVSNGFLKSTQVLRKSVVSGAISNPKQIERLVASQTIFPGEQISLTRFSSVAEHGIRGLLRGNMRAIEIAGDPNQTLAGTLQAGDHVDVVANINSKKQYVDRIILRNIRVLRAPSAPSSTSGLSSGPGSQTESVMLAVTDTQVQRLTAAVGNEDWWLELRPVVKATDSLETVQTKKTLIEDGLSAKELKVAHYGAGK